MDVEKLDVPLLALIPVAIVVAMTAFVVISDQSGDAAVAYSCGFTRGQGAAFFQTHPSAKMEPELARCTEFRKAAIARGFTPATWTVNNEH